MPGSCGTCAVEQHRHWRPGRASAPGYLEQCRQLTAARAEHPWLAAGSQMVQQQALRDFAQAVAAFFDPENPAGRPSWRKAGQDEGFRVVALRPGDVRPLSRHVGQVRVPKARWVRFRWSRAVPPGVKSCRVRMDRAGRWHVAFAVIPEPVPCSRQRGTVGIDRGVAVSAALSTGNMVTAPGLKRGPPASVAAPAAPARPLPAGSNRRARVKRAVARLRAREADARKDWAEKASTGIARRFDLIKVEDLRITNMTRSARGTAQNPGTNVRAKAGLNREILRSGWGLLVRRLEDKAPGRVKKVKPHYTSQRCSACGHVDAESRESQARFVCTACGFAGNAGCERGQEHRGGARRDCAGDAAMPGYPAYDTPRTSTSLLQSDA